MRPRVHITYESTVRSDKVKCCAMLRRSGWWVVQYPAHAAALGGPHHCRLLLRLFRPLLRRLQQGAQPHARRARPATAEGRRPGSCPQLHNPTGSGVRRLPAAAAARSRPAHPRPARTGTRTCCSSSMPLGVMPLHLLLTRRGGSSSALPSLLLLLLLLPLHG